MNSLPHLALERLRRGESCALVTVVNQDGSSPRGAGSVMLVTRDGSVHGSVQLPAEAAEHAVDPICSTQ